VTGDPIGRVVVLPADHGPGRFDVLPVTDRLARDFTVCDPWFAPPADDLVVRVQTRETLYDRLDEAGRTWTVYRDAWSAFFADVRAATLADLVVLDPPRAARDDAATMEAAIARVYNALRATADVWSSTLLVVGPALERRPPRRPILLVSPWLEARVDHTGFDSTSLLRYLTEKWVLGPLSPRTARAPSLDEALQFLPEPRRETVPFLDPAQASYGSGPLLRSA
jgi:hypothetical protein